MSDASLGFYWNFADNQAHNSTSGRWYGHFFNDPPADGRIDPQWLDADDHAWSGGDTARELAAGAHARTMALSYNAFITTFNPFRVVLTSAQQNALLADWQTGNKPAMILPPDAPGTLALVGQDGVRFASVDYVDLLAALRGDTPASPIPAAFNAIVQTSQAQATTKAGTSTTHPNKFLAMAMGLVRAFATPSTSKTTAERMKPTSFFPFAAIAALAALLAGCMIPASPVPPSKIRGNLHTGEISLDLPKQDSFDRFWLRKQGTNLEIEIRGMNAHNDAQTISNAYNGQAAVVRETMTGSLNLLNAGATIAGIAAKAAAAVP